VARPCEWVGRTWVWRGRWDLVLRRGAGASTATVTLAAVVWV